MRKWVRWYGARVCKQPASRSKELFVANEFDVVDVGPDGAELVVKLGVLRADPGPRGAIGSARSCHEVFERYREAGTLELVLHASGPSHF